MQIKNYVIAPCFVEYLINKYGKKIFLEFIKEFKLSHCYVYSEMV